MTMTSNPELRVPIVMDRTSVPEDEDIVAVPLEQVDWADVKAKNAGISLRWINHVFQNGLRYQQACYQGYTNATPQDVTDIPSSYFKEGKIINGDLILMKIDSKKYRGALKHRRLQAESRTSPQGKANQHRGHINQAVQETTPDQRVAEQVASRLHIEAPQGAELEKLVGPDVPVVATPNPQLAPKPGAPPATK